MPANTATLPRIACTPIRRSRTGMRTGVQSPCRYGPEPGHQDRHGQRRKRHRGTGEVNVKIGAPRGPHGERDEWLTVDEVCAELKISRRTFDR